MLLVSREGFLQRTAPAESGVDRFGEPFRAAKSIGDPGSRARIFLITGIADQGPAGAVRPAQVIRNRSADKVRFAAAPAHAFRKFRRVLLNNLGVVLLNVGPDGGQISGGKRHADQREIVVGVVGKDHSVGAQPQVPALHVPGTFERCAGLGLGCLHGLCNHGEHAVGANDNARLFRNQASFVPSADANDAVVLPDEFLDGKTVAQLGPGFHGRRGQYGIEHDPARSKRGVHTVHRRNWPRE